MQKYIWATPNCKELMVPSFSKISICLLLVLLIQKDKVLLCFSVKAPKNVFHMIIVVVMINFSLKAKALFL